MDVAEVLVTVVHADGTAGVVRDLDGHAWLMGLLEERGATGVSAYRPAVAGLSGDRTVQGGLLPDGAVSAEVLDDAGERISVPARNGAWVVVLDQPVTGRVIPVRYVAANGDSVPPPLPDEWPRERVDDAEDPCPACGACAWDVTRALDESRGARGTPAGETEPTPFVVCRVCGHQESCGAWMRAEVAQEEDPAVVAERLRQFTAHWRRQSRAVLSRVDFPIYAATGRSGRLGGWGGASETSPHRITVAHEPHGDERATLLHIETITAGEVFETLTALIRRELESLLHDAGEAWPQCSEAAMAIWLHARARRYRRAAALATHGPRVFEVDGEPVKFELADAGGSWVAAVTHADLVIVISARGIPCQDVSLHTVADPLATLVEMPAT